MTMRRTLARRAAAAGRLTKVAITSVLVSAGLLTATATAAHASIWQVSDGFDYQPASTWQLTHVGTGGGLFELNAGTARTAPNNAYLWAQNNFSSVGRSVTLRNNSTRNFCIAGIYLKGLSGVKVNFEVINPSTWTYISLKTVTLTGGGYTQATVPSWQGGPNTVYVRVSLLGSGSFSSVRVDDLVVQCTY